MSVQKLLEGSFWRNTRQHLEAFLHRSIRSRLCPPEQTCLTELVEAADDSLFQRILSNDNHIPVSYTHLTLPTIYSV